MFRNPLTQVFILSLIAVFNNCLGQVTHDYYSVSLNTENSISSNTVYDCTYDQVGNLWLATSVGVTKYNGVEVINFTTEDGLSDNEVLQLYADRENNIWMMCNNGKLCFYNNDQHVLHNSFDMPFLGWVEDGARIVDIFQNNKNEYFISTHKNCYRIDRFGSINKISLPNSVVPSTSNFFEMNDEVYLFKDGFLVNVSNGIVNGVSVPYGNSIWVSAAYLNNRIFFNSRNGVLFECDLNTKPINKYDIGMNQSIKNINVFNQHLYLSTTNGVYEYSGKSGLIRLFNSNNVTSVAFSNFHESFAISTYDDGCMVYPDTSISNYYFDKEKSGSYVGKIVSSPSLGLVLLHNSAQVTTIKQSYVKSLVINPGGGSKNLYGALLINDCLSTIGGSGQGSLYDFKSNKVLLNYGHSNFKDQLVLDENRLISQTPDYIRQLGRVEDVEAQTILSNNEDNGFLEIERFNNHLIIIRTPRSFVLFDYNLKKRIWTYKINLSEKCKVFSFHIDYNKIAWISIIPFGVISYNPFTQIFTHYSNSFGDHLGYSFYSTPNESFAFSKNVVFRLNHIKSEMLPIVYLPNEKINDINLYDNQMAVGTVNGLILKNGFSVKDHGLRDYFKVYKVVVNGQHEDDTSVTLQFDVRNKIELLIDFIPAKYLKFSKPSYRIIGYNNDWIELNDANLVLPALSPGRYQVEFRTMLSDGSFITQPFRLNLNILVPFWNRLYVKMLILLFLIGVFVFTLLIVLRFNRMVRVKNESQIEFLKLERRRAAAEYKAFFLQINPHFIFNTINNIKNIYNTGDIDRGNKYVQQFARSMRNVLEFVDMNYITVDQEIDYLSSYCDIFLFSINFSYSFELEYDDIRYLEIPPMILQPFVENAIIHGLQNKNSNDRVLKITFKQFDEETLLVEILDNGVGRSFKKKPSVVGKTSKGLEITSKRLEIMFGDQHNNNNNINFEDIVDANDVGIGTRVKILIPIR